MSAADHFATRAARAVEPPPSVSRPLTPPIHLANVYAFRFTRDGRRVYSCSGDRTVRVFGL